MMLKFRFYLKYFDPLKSSFSPFFVPKSTVCDVIVVYILLFIGTM